MRWFQALLPREDSFFEHFVAHARVLVKGAEALPCSTAVARLRPPARRFFSRKRPLTRSPAGCSWPCVAPLSPPLIVGTSEYLITSLDDAIDQIQKTAKSIILFGLLEFGPEMRELGDLAIQAAYLTLEATELLRDMRRNADRLNAIAAAVTRIENRSDEVYDAGMKALFAACQGCPMDFIAGAEVFDHLEKVIDRFEDVANGVSGILIEHL